MGESSCQFVQGRCGRIIRLDLRTRVHVICEDGADVLTEERNRVHFRQAHFGRTLQNKQTLYIFKVFESEHKFFGVFATSNTKGEFESAVCQFSFDELDDKFVSFNFEDEHGKKTKNWESYRNEVNEPYSHPYLCSDGKCHTQSHYYIC